MLAENFVERGGGRGQAAACQLSGSPTRPCAVGKGGAATRAREWSCLTALSEYSKRRRQQSYTGFSATDVLGFY